MQPQGVGKEAALLLEQCSIETLLPGAAETGFLKGLNQRSELSDINGDQVFVQEEHKV